MRLENKMHKWLKLFLKLIPFYFIIYNLIAFIGSDLGPMFSINAGDDYSENVYNWSQSIYQIVFDSLINFNEFTVLPSVFTDFNSYFITLFDFVGPNGNEIIDYVLRVLEWFFVIDLLDLMLSIFRFIIDVCRSWLDGFYDKNKGGY